MDTENQDGVVKDFTYYAHERALTTQALEDKGHPEEDKGDAKKTIYPAEDSIKFYL